MEIYSNKVCLQCQKPLVGRVDKVFCDPQCRNSYHNRIKRSDEQYIKLVNSAIRKNRRILKTLAPIGKVIVRREILESMGYTFDFFSTIYHTSNSAYYMCYDYGFRALIDNGKQKVQIIQQQEYMTKAFDPWASSSS